jgi:hypothetical protein
MLNIQATNSRSRPAAAPDCATARTCHEDGIARHTRSKQSVHAQTLQKLYASIVRVRTCHEDEDVSRGVTQVDGHGLKQQQQQQQQTAAAAADSRSSKCQPCYLVSITAGEWPWPNQTARNRHAQRETGR